LWEQILKRRESSGLKVKPPASSTNGWVHLSQAIDPTEAGLEGFGGIDFKNTSYGGYPTNAITFWIDNLVVHLSSTELAPPKLGIPYKPVPGLNLFSSGSNGDQYQRTNIRLQNTTGVGGWVPPGR